MTRPQAIAIITSKLDELDDERVFAVADMVQDIDAESELPRELTDEELRIIEQSKEDFRHGRTLSSAEYKADIEAFMTVLRSKYAAKA